MKDIKLKKLAFFYKVIPLNRRLKRLLKKILKTGNLDVTIWSFLNNKKETALIAAVKYDSIDLLKELLVLGANVNAKDKSGATALWYAVEKERIGMVRYLLEYGADTEVKVGQETPLFYAAAILGDLKIVNLLLSYGANPNLIVLGDDLEREHILDIVEENGHHKVRIALERNLRR